MLAETNEDDNVLSTSVEVTASTLPNLTLASSDIVAVPASLLEGGSASLEARVRNLGAGEAAAFDVRFFAGDPLAEGRLIGQVPVTDLAASSDAVVSVNWDPIQGRDETLVYVDVDAARAVEEIDEDDNLVFRAFDIEGLPDLLTTSASVRLAPAFARSGGARYGHIELHERWRAAVGADVSRAPARRSRGRRSRRFGGD